MRTNTFINRIKDVAMTKRGKIAVRYLDAISTIEYMANGKAMYPYHWSRNAGRCRLDGETEVGNTVVLLGKLGIKLSWGNDAPRGGKEGDYMYLAKAEIKKLKDVEFIKIYENYK